MLSRVRNWVHKWTAPAKPARRKRKPRHVQPSVTTDQTIHPAWHADEIRRLKREFDALPSEQRTKCKDQVAAEIDAHLAFIRRFDPAF